MTHNAKVDVYVLAAIVLGMVVFLLGDYWIAGPILVILFLCAYPQSYITTPYALVIRGALSRHVIPYAAIRHIGPPAEDGRTFAVTAHHIAIEYAPASHVVIEPADRDAFLRDIAAHAPHLIKRGQRLIAAFA
jgi:hypothetical protein